MTESTLSTRCCLKRLAGAQPGQSNVYMADLPDGDLSLKCHRKVNKKMGDRCFGDVYTRMHPDRPSPTITTKCHYVFFPIDEIEPVARMIGNAVPPRLAAFYSSYLAHSVKHKFVGRVGRR